MEKERPEEEKMKVEKPEAEKTEAEEMKQMRWRFQRSENETREDVSMRKHF